MEIIKYRTTALHLLEGPPPIFLNLIIFGTKELIADNVYISEAPPIWSVPYFGNCSTGSHVSHIFLLFPERPLSLFTQKWKSRYNWIIIVRNIMTYYDLYVQMAEPEFKNLNYDSKVLGGSSVVNPDLILAPMQIISNLLESQKCSVLSVIGLFYIYHLVSKVIYVKHSLHRKKRVQLFCSSSRKWNLSCKTW